VFECGGDAYEITLCEDTDGDGLGNPGSEVVECIEGGRDEITDGCDLPDMNLYLGANGEVYYNSSESIGGFQFNVDGGTVSAASGGDAASAGFMVSTGSDIVLGFSLSGGSFTGCGILTNLTLSDGVTGLSNLIFSNTLGLQMSFVYYAPVDDADLVQDCSDQYPDCAANEFDCTGECGGDAVEDNCGTCDNDATNDCVQDCASVWGGDAVVDNCGTCDSDSSNDCVQDCAGTWGGDLVDDECDVCGGDDSTCADCAGVPNGDAYINECGDCFSELNPSNFISGAGHLNLALQPDSTVVAWGNNSFGETDVPEDLSDVVAHRFHQSYYYPKLQLCYLAVMQG
jgi:hypothetical protein